ncbi:hypothetical protein Tco_1246223 [Tanacetum coccineum]
MRAFEQVADMKEPFDLSKVKDPSAPIEALLSKKPLTLQEDLAPSTDTNSVAVHLKATSDPRFYVPIQFLRVAWYLEQSVTVHASPLNN